MKKIRTVSALLLAVLLLMSTLTACGSESSSTPQTSVDTSTIETAPEKDTSAEVPADNAIHAFGGGSSGGGYYTISNVLSQYFNEHNLGTFTAQPTTGGGQNGLLMQAGDLDIAVINGANCMEAYTGSTESYSEPYTDLRAIAVLYSGCFQMLVTNDDSIQTMEDLKGRKIGIGASGSGDNGHANRIFDACGFGVAGIDPQYIGVNESSDQLKDGQIDGFINMASLPYSVVVEQTMSGKGKLIGLTDAQVEKLTSSDDAVYFPYTIPAGTYEGQDEEITTVALPTVLCVDANRISDDLAYNITKIIYENTEELDELYAGFDLDPQASLDAIKIPLHTGAEKYYQELGLL